MVKNPPVGAGDSGSIPAPETKIPRVSGQLSSCATAAETWVHGVHAPQPEKPRQINQSTTTGKAPLLTATREPKSSNGDPVQPDINRLTSEKKKESYLLPQPPPPPQVTMRKPLGCVFSNFFPPLHLFTCKYMPECQSLHIVFFF